MGQATKPDKENFRAKIQKKKKAMQLNSEILQIRQHRLNIFLLLQKSWCS